MTPNNPHKLNSIAWQEFNTYCGWYADMPTRALARKHQECLADSKDYHRYGWKTMQNRAFQAECIETILAART